MRVFLFSTAVAVMFTMAGSLRAQDLSDTTRTEILEASIVKSVTVPKDAPLAVANLDYKDLGDFSKSGKEIPFLLASTPGVEDRRNGISLPDFEKTVRSL